MAEPVTLEEAKQQTRMVEDDSEDAFLTSLIAPARAYVERIARVVLVAGTRTESFPRWGDYLELWRRPIATVDSVTYDGTDYADFSVDVTAFPVRIHPGSEGFPTLEAGQTILVEYTTGAVDTTSEEYLIAKRAILLLIGHWFENRETAVIGMASSEVDFAVRELLDSIRPVSAY